MSCHEDYYGDVTGSKRVCVKKESTAEESQGTGRSLRQMLYIPEPTGWKTNLRARNIGGGRDWVFGVSGFKAMVEGIYFHPFSACTRSLGLRVNMFGCVLLQIA